MAYSDRPMPAATEAERAVLSCCLMSPDDCLDEVLERLPDSRAFTLYPLRRVYECLKGMRTTYLPREIDLPALTSVMERRGWLEDIGGWPVLHEMAGVAPTTVNLDRHVSSVREAFLLRNFMETSVRLVGEAHDRPDDVGVFMEYAERELRRLTEQCTGLGYRPPTLPHLIEELDNRIERLRAGMLSRVPWYLAPRLESAPLEPGTLTVIGARPRVGKTAMMMTAALHQVNAIPPFRPPNRAHTVGIICIEMSAEALIARAFSQLSGVPTRHILDGMRERLADGTYRDLQQSSLDAISRAKSTLSGAPLHMQCGRRMGVDEVMRLIRYWRRYEGVDIVYIDHLTRLVKGQADIREQMVRITGDLKQLALDLDITIVGLAQLNRNASEVPSLSHLKESGSIEEDADNIVLLDRPDVETPNLGKRNYRDANGDAIDMHGRAAVLLAKTRNDAGGLAILEFDGTRMCFQRCKSVPQVDSERG